MIYLIVVIAILALFLIVAVIVKPKHIHIEFPSPPRLEWGEKRRAVALPNGDLYIIPQKAKGHFVSLYD